jgi:tRNA A-37 threonylcarbamoyl transferase component Bud32
MSLRLVDDFKSFPENNIIHNDITVNNITILEKNREFYPTIIDFDNSYISNNKFYLNLFFEKSQKPY